MFRQLGAELIGRNELVGSFAWIGSDSDAASIITNFYGGARSGDGPWMGSSESQRPSLGS
jgi:hypothetical protein